MSDNITGTWVTFERVFKARPTVQELADFTAGFPDSAKVTFTDSTGLAGLKNGTMVKVRYEVGDDIIYDAPEARP